MSKEKKEPRECECYYDIIQCEGTPSIFIEKSAYDTLKATLDKRELALAYAQMETDLRAEIEFLHKHVEKLAESERNNWNKHEEYVAKLEAENERLQVKLETEQESAHFYRREWESACERYDYQCEENERLKEELEDAEDAVGGWSYGYKKAEAEIELLREENERLTELVQRDIGSSAFDAVVEENERLTSELEEQAKLNGMGAERELKLITELEQAKSDIDYFKSSCKQYMQHYSDCKELIEQYRSEHDQMVRSHASTFEQNRDLKLQAERYRTALEASRELIGPWLSAFISDEENPPCDEFKADIEAWFKLVTLEEYW